MSKKISLGHGSGGKLTRDLINEVFLPRLGNDELNSLGDAAALQLEGRRLLFTTDSFVIKPLEFPGGDIGKLAVCGTINDLAVSGGRPLWLSCGLIVEENFEIDRLERIIDSIAQEARAAGVRIVCGDTKVVERGGADGLFINTAGIGVPIDGFQTTTIEPGDRIIVNGTIGDHEAAIFHVREELGRGVALASDCAALHDLVATMLHAAPQGVRVMRDATRGGVGAVLNELAGGSQCSLTVEEDDIPIRSEVRGLCELVGFEAIYMANEGKLVCIASADTADDLLAVMRKHPLGACAAIIGEAVPDKHERVYMRSGFGGRRVITMPTGLQLPRIC